MLRLLQPTAASSIGRYGFQACNRSNTLRTRSLRELSYSRMLDMGGAPSANSDQSLLRTVNASKNSRLQAVAFDFQTLININEKDGSEDAAVDITKQLQENQESLPAAIPDVDRVQQVANLLGIELGSTENEPDVAAQKPKSKAMNYDPSVNDVRAKYAAKLKGGLAGIELAKSSVEETLVAGDAAGHLAARKLAIMGGAPTDGGSVATRWLPSQAATQLLTLLTHRSIRIVLLPSLERKGDEKEPRMEDFKSQLKNVVFDKLIPEFDNGDDSDAGIEDALKKGILKELDVDPNKVLLVSQREPYLRVGRDMGMNICRIRPKNGRRGSITAHYTVESVGEIQDVVNEINGISFNTVLNR
eukprot:CAMPEP_0116087670 /NCGR_PEP_ID=MMETSP0327-20121206/5481_1 /TAXON_ID=44447 /ORGANISM="Pseudo-nitzschia delicatissima, Strain B596" /LENGTH=358 /DNA_ID=CAMNT_0003578741 /DNA_START=39 /DNA_END=1115 /DNA_ORIENTATION=+